MTRTIALGMLGLALFCNTVNAQTPVEQAQILSDFQASVVEYAQHHAGAPAPRIFTLPVAMVFRQLIARATSDDLEQLTRALPVLPMPLQYQMIGDDLAIRDTDANVTVAVLRDAIALTTHHLQASISGPKGGLP